MGKKTNLALGTLLGISTFLGVCNNKIQNKEIFNLTSEIELKDSLMEYNALKYDDSCSALQLRLDGKTDTIKKTNELYQGSVKENKNLRNQLSGLRKTVVNLEKALKISENLEDKKFKIQFDSLRQEYFGALEDSMSLDSTKYANLEKRFNELNDLYKKEVNKKSNEASDTYYASKDKDAYIRDLESKDKRFIHSWKFIRPRLYDWGANSITAIDNDPKGMYAFAVFDQDKKIPLKRMDQSKKTATFGWTPSIKNLEGSFEVYFHDKDDNESSRYRYTIKNGVISKDKTM